MNKKLIKFNDLYLQYRNISNFIEKDFRKIIRNTEFINGSFVKLFEKNFKKMNSFILSRIWLMSILSYNL